MDKEQALNDYMKASFENMKDIKKARKKKIVIISIISFILLCLLCWSPFAFVSPFHKYLRYYDIRLNNYQFMVSEKIYNTKIIPNIMEFPNGNSGFFDYKYEKEKFSVKNTPYIFSLKSYTCFLPNDKNYKIKTSCTGYNDYKVANKNNDTSYKMQILKYDYNSKYIGYYISEDHIAGNYQIREDAFKTYPIFEHTIIYNGKLITNLTDYISNPGVYAIKINFSYKNTKGILYFGLINDGEYITII